MKLRPVPTVLFVVPCYNEEEVLGQTVNALLSELDQLNLSDLAARDESGILLVDDGSIDATWKGIQFWIDQDPRVNGLRLSRNKGHQAALLAGLSVVVDLADVSISIDADLQDDIGTCRDMLLLYRQGFDIVYGVRADRSTDSATKRFFANFFYSFMVFMGVEIIPGHADFRMMSCRALAELLKYTENSLFLRGLIPQLGYKTERVYYDRKIRQSGSSKYPFRKSLSLAVDGIISLSYKPLRYIAYLGVIMSAASCITIILIIADYVRGGTIQGWPSLMVVVTTIGGVQLLAIGLIGEYLGRVYKEVKRRPRYHVRDAVGALLKSG